MLKIEVGISAEAAAIFAAERLIDVVAGKADAVLGLATGGTMLPVYRQVVHLSKQRQVSFARCRTFNLDEYVGLGSHSPQSYRRFMNVELFSQVDFDTDKIALPDGLAADPYAEAHAYEASIAGHGLDFQILGIGHNGHIGFNEPGTAFDSPSHVVDLDETTRRSNSIYFARPEDVPRRAITMGIGTIMSAKQIVLVAFGAAKASILAEAFYGEVTPACPASILQRHPNVVLVLDTAAAANLRPQDLG